MATKQTEHQENPYTPTTPSSSSAGSNRTKIFTCTIRNSHADGNPSRRSPPRMDPETSRRRQEEEDDEAMRDEVLAEMHAHQ
jgi:hypothetical protein